MTWSEDDDRALLEQFAEWLWAEAEVGISNSDIGRFLASREAAALARYGTNEDVHHGT